MIKWGSGSARAALLVMLAVAVPAAAQITTGTVVGTVQDAQGGVVPGVTVVLVSQTRGTKMVPVVTGAQGNFVVPNVTPDTYTIEIAMEGFKSISRADVAVSGGDRVTVPTFTLEVGGATETITVTGSAPLIQAQSGERSYAVTAEQVANLPFSNRGFTALAALAPGMDGGNRLGGGGANNVMMDGVSTMDTGNNAPVLNLNTEAIAEVKVLTSGYQAEFGRSSGVQITAVTKSGTNRFHGSVYDVLRNSDWNSNSWQNKLNGNPKNVSKESDFGYTIGGPVGKVGGDNKLFFFHSLEWRPRESGGQVRQFRFPTALERNGDFSQTRDNNGNLYNAIRDPNLSGTCSTTVATACFQDGGVKGRIPQDRLYAPGLAILRQYPMPNIDRPGVGYNYEDFSPVQKILNTQPSIRLDYQPRQDLRVTFKYAGERQRQQLFLGTLPGFNDVMVPKPVITSLSTTVNYTISPTTFIEATYGMSQNELAGCVNLNSICANAVPMSPTANKFTAGLGDLPVLFPDGLALNPDYYEYKTLEAMNAPFFVDGRLEMPPTFQWGNRVSNAPPNIGYPGWLNINRTQDVAISLTKVRGRHTLKAGFYNNHSYKAQHRGGGGAGSMNFGQDASNPMDTTFGFSNAATGTFNSITQLSKFVEGGWIYNNTEAYIQDNWKVSNRLTLDYGMRFVRQQPQYDNYLQSSNFLPETWDPAQAPQVYGVSCRNGVFPCSGSNRAAINPVTGQFVPQNLSALAIGALVPGSGNMINGLHRAGEDIVDTAYTWPSLAFAPRVGFAYDLSGTQSFVIRGGSGLFYDRPDGNSVYGLISNPPFANSVTLRYGDLRTLSTGGISFSGPPALSVFEYDADLPSSTQWNGGIQMALPWSSAIDVEYVGQHSFNTLQGVQINVIDMGTTFLPQYQDPTQTPTIFGSNTVSQNAMRPYRGYGNINQQWSRGWNTYHSVQSSFNRRFRDGISFGLNYTLGLKNEAAAGARLEHDPITGELRYRADQEEAQRIGLGQQNLERHTFRGNFVWDLPDLQAESMLLRGVGLVVNDWQLSGIFTGGSAPRYTIGYSYQGGVGNQNITGSPNYGGRVNIIGDPGKGCTDNQYEQFNTAAFSGPQVGSVGLESGQNYMVGCPEHEFDLAIARNIRFGGGRQVQIQVQMFNAFNTVTYTGRSTNMSLNSIEGQSITNFQYNPDGTLVQTRLRPNNAGFGAVTSARNLRSVQARVSFQF